MSDSSQPKSKKDDGSLGCILWIIGILGFFFLIHLLSQGNSTDYRWDPLADPDMYRDPIGY